MKKVIKVPRVNVNDNEVEISFLHKEDQEFLHEGDDLVDLGTSKAVFTFQSTQTGYVKLLFKRGDLANVGDDLVYIYDSIEELLSDKSNEVIKPSKTNTNISNTENKNKNLNLNSNFFHSQFETTIFSKAAEQLIKEKGINKELFNQMGLITTDLVLEKISLIKKNNEASVSHETDLSKAVKENLQSTKINKLKHAEIESLTIGQEGLINSNLSITFNTRNIRNQLSENGTYDGNLLPIIIFEVAKLIEKRPAFNAFYNNGSIHFYNRTDIGIAVDLGKGLKVIKIKDTHKYLPAELYEKLIDFGIRYIENKIELEELQDSTITITDVSRFDINQFFPLINGRQSAIIGVAADSTHPDFPTTISITFDHRVLTGQEVGSFLKELRSRFIELDNQVNVSNKINHKTNFTFDYSKCHRCYIDIDSYYEKYNKNAAFHVIIKKDGTPGVLCHSCIAGYSC